MTPPSPLPKPPYFILYRRVSTGKQVEKDLSLPAQAREQDEAVQRLGGSVLGSFEDGGISGKTDKREGFQAALALAKSPEAQALIRQGHGVYLLVWKTSRAFRNRRLAVNTKADLREVGVKVLSITEAFVGGDSLGDKAMEGIMEVLDEIKTAEARQDAMRGHKQMAQKAGRQIGTVPFGYALVKPGQQGGGVAPDPLTAAFVPKIFHLFDEGATLAELAREMNAAGPLSPSRHRAVNRQVAGHWIGTSLRDILANRFYVGEVKWRNPDTQQIEHFPGAHEPLVDRELFERVQARLVRQTQGRRAQAQGIFSGLLRCPLCGSLLYTQTIRMPGVTGVKGGNPLYTRYHCGRRAQTIRARVYGASEDKDFPSTCPGWQIGERKTVELFKDALDDLEGSALLMAQTRKTAKQNFDTPIWPTLSSSVAPLDEKDALERQRQALNDSREAYSWQHAHRLLSDHELIDRVRALETQRAKLDEALARLANPAPPLALRLTSAHVHELREILTSGTLTPAEKREKLSKRIDHITPDVDKAFLTLYFGTP